MGLSNAPGLANTFCEKEELARYWRNIYQTVYKYSGITNYHHPREMLWTHVRVNGDTLAVLGVPLSIETDSVS